MAAQASEQMEMVRRWYEAANARDIDTVFAALDPDFEFRTAGHFPDLDQVYRGREAFAGFLNDFGEPWDELTIRPEKIIPTGTQILVFARFHARGRDAVEVNLLFAHLWTLRDGLAVRLEGYADETQALRAAGLSPSEPSA